MTLGVIGKKVGMTQIFDSEGLAVPVTVIKVDSIVVTQVKTVETDGYNAIQVGTIAAKEKHLTKAEIGHFKKNGLNNYRRLQEFRVENPADFKVGQEIDLSVLIFVNGGFPITKSYFSLNSYFKKSAQIKFILIFSGM